jgi:hypothetical protein
VRPERVPGVVIQEKLADTEMTEQFDTNGPEFDFSEWVAGFAAGYAAERSPGRVRRGLVGGLPEPGNNSKDP